MRALSRHLFSAPSPCQDSLPVFQESRVTGRVGFRNFLPPSRRALLYLCLLCPLSAWCQLKDENLIQNLPAGYKVGFQTKKGNMEITEMIPDPESLQQWTEMLTTQVFHGLRNATPESFQISMQQGIQVSCPGGMSAPVAKGEENGYPFAVGMIACPMNRSTGKPEFVWFKAIKGNDSFYVVQKAFRFEPSSEEVTRWTRYLASVTVCDTRLVNQKCPTLRPIGVK